MCGSPCFRTSCLICKFSAIMHAFVGVSTLLGNTVSIWKGPCTGVQLENCQEGDKFDGKKVRGASLLLFPHLTQVPSGQTYQVTCHSRVGPAFSTTDPLTRCVQKPAFKDNPLAALFHCLQYLQATKQRSFKSANTLLRANIAPF